MSACPSMKLIESGEFELTSCQEEALKILRGDENVFLTGSAGTGKSYLINEYKKFFSPKKHPIVASTGAAAILVGGRTFHSFFGLGIMQGGYEKTIERALKNRRLKSRLKKVVSIMIDEISMLSGESLRAAEEIAFRIREEEAPWGGIKVVAVGDFAQLPPVSRFRDRPDWAFEDRVWERTNFTPICLDTVVRTQDREFLEILNFIRRGVVNEQVRTFLNSRVVDEARDLDMTKLHSRRDFVERINLQKLNELPGEAKVFETVYESKDQRYIESMKKNAPIPERLNLKLGALVMIRKNDPSQGYVNGSLGIVTQIKENEIQIQLKAGWPVLLEKSAFTLLDAEGAEVAGAFNFPVNLAYATTIHKSQGMTLDSAVIDLRQLWEPGHAYVALSRVKSPDGLYLTGWSENSIKTDEKVVQFYNQIVK